MSSVPIVCVDCHREIDEDKDIFCTTYAYGGPRRHHDTCWDAMNEEKVRAETVWSNFWEMGATPGQRLPDEED